MQKLNKIRRTHYNKKNRKHQTKQKSFEKNRNNRNTGYPAQDPTANIYHIFIRGDSWAGYPVFMLFMFCSKLFCFILLFPVVVYVFA